MAGLPLTGIDATTPGEAGNLEHRSPPVTDASAGEFAKLRREALGHLDPASHSRHAVYFKDKVTAPAFLRWPLR